MPGTLTSREVGNTNPLSAADAHALWAETYDQKPNPLLALEERTVHPLLPCLSGVFVLDIACGTGRWLKKLLQGGARAGAGLDFSPQMLAQAAKHRLLGKRLIRADSAVLPLADSIADIAFCSFAADYFPRLDLPALELARVLKQGGELFVTDFHPSAYERGWRRSFRCEKRVVEIASFKYSMEFVCKTFTSAGFTLQSLENPCFEETEKPIFESCGKGLLFHSLRNAPAIYICHFKLPESKPRRRSPV